MLGQPDASALAEQAAVAIQAIHSPGNVGIESLNAARDLHRQITEHPAVLPIASQLVDPKRPPQVQHFGFQVLLAALKRQPCSFTLDQRKDLRAHVVNLVNYAQNQAPYVRSKCTELIGELARVDWPDNWPELKPALLQACVSSSPIACALGMSAWSQIAGLLTQDAKDLSQNHKRKLTCALQEIGEKPADKPELIAAIQEALNQHGGDMNVVREAMELCKMLCNAVPVKMLLHHRLDQILAIGLYVDELRCHVVSALGEWVERMILVFGGKTGTKIPDLPDLCRFTAMLVQLVNRCLFDGSQVSYEFHRQVAELIQDFCQTHTAHLVGSLPPADLTAVFSALMHLYRYPSQYVQCCSASAIESLGRARAKTDTTKDGYLGSKANSLPALEDMFGIVFFHLVKKNQLPKPLSPDRSEWLMRCLGKPSTTANVANIENWLELMSQTKSYDMFDDTDYTVMWAKLRTKSVNCLAEYCKPAPNCSDSVGWTTLCRLAGFSVAKCLIAPGGPWSAEFDASLCLIESPGTWTLRNFSKMGLDLPSMLEPSLALVRQVAGVMPTFCESVEIRRMEFLSAWAPLIKHFSDDIIKQILHKIVKDIENPPADVSELSQGNLIRRAADTLTSLGKWGVLNVVHVEALNVDFCRISGKLKPSTRAKLTEALAAAVAGCTSVDFPKRQEQVCAIMQETSNFWQTNQVVQSGDAKGILEMFEGNLTSGAHFEQLSDLRLALQTFNAVISKSINALGISNSKGVATSCDDETLPDAQEPDVHDHIAAPIIRSWAKGVFALARSLLSWRALGASSQNPVVQRLVGSLWPDEIRMITGASKVDLVLPDGLDEASVKKLLVRMFELQVGVFQAMKHCMTSRCFWEIPEAAAWVKAVFECFPLQPACTATNIIREVLSPVFVKRKASVNTLGESVCSAACGEILPGIITGIRQILRRVWAPVPANLDEIQEHAFALSATVFVRNAAVFLGNIAGLGFSSSSQLIYPRNAWMSVNAEERSEIQGRSAAAKRKAARNKNRFAALADDQDDTPAPKNGSNEPDHASIFTLVSMRNPKVRDLLRAALFDLASLPDADTVEKACNGLHAWCVQLWNLIVRGDDVGTLSTGDIHESDAGQFVHVATAALRALAGEVLKPLFAIVTRGNRVWNDAPNANVRDYWQVQPGPVQIAPSPMLVTVVEQSWRVFVEPAMSKGVVGPSPFIRIAAPIATCVLAVLVKLYTVQCHKVSVHATIENTYLNPTLTETIKLFRALPSTSDKDVSGMLDAFFSSPASPINDDMTSSIRAVLHGATFQAPANGQH